jgi:hypothetical protein
MEGGLPHVPQRAPNWCGAACGEMSAGRLGVEVTQEQLVAVPGGFEPRVVVGGQEITAGGFQTEGLVQALDQAAPVAGRQWIGGLARQDMSVPNALRETMQGYLESSRGSIILRVRGGNHWIVVDQVLPGGMIAIRDPAAARSALLSAEQLSSMGPTGELVISLPVKR